MTPAPGDFFVVATPGLVAGCIRATTHSWANHAGLYVGDGRIIEGNPGGVAEAPAAKYDGLHIAWSHQPLTPSQRDAIVGAAREAIGIPYSFLDIAAIATETWPLIWHLAESRLDRGDRLICSQLVARAYRLGAGITLVPGKPDNYVRPADLADLLT